MGQARVWTSAPGTQEPPEGTRHASQIACEECQEQPHMAEGRLRDAQPEPLVLYGQCPFPRSFCSAPQMQETNRTGGSPEYQTLADEADPAASHPMLHTHLSLVSLWVFISTSAAFPGSRNHIKKENIKRKEKVLPNNFSRIHLQRHCSICLNTPL